MVPVFRLLTCLLVIHKIQTEIVAARPLGTEGSTSTQSLRSSPTTVADHTEYINLDTAAVPSSYTLAGSTVVSESRTTSNYSAEAEQNETPRNDAGPSLPHPYSEWDRYPGPHHTAGEQPIVDAWHWERNYWKEATANWHNQ